MNRELQVTSDVETALTDKSLSLLSKYAAIQVDDDSSAESATDWIKFSKTFVKQAEEDRKKLTSPLNSVIKEINSRYKSITEPLIFAESRLRTSLTDYMRKKERKAQARAEAVRHKLEEEAIAEAEALQAKGHEREAEHTLVVASETKVSSGKMPTRTDYGNTSSLRDNWTFEVTDLDKLFYARPDLVKPNDVAIRGLVKDGTRVLPGVHIFNDRTVAVR